MNGGDLSKTSEGVNYLEVCDWARGEYSEEANSFAEGLRSVLSGNQKKFIMEYPCHSPDQWRWHLADVTPYLGNEVACAVVCHTDISEQKRAELRLEEKEQHLRALFENALDAIWVVNNERRYVEANPAACEMLGLAREDLLGSGVENFCPPEARNQVEKLWSAFLEQGEIQGEVELRRADGTRLYTEYRAKANYLPHRHLFVVRDVTIRKRLEERLVQQAFHDSLTGLPNRALLMDRLEHALRREEREPKALALLFVDLDEFKAINDDLGHATGDRVLVLIAQRLKECIRKVDTLSRLGGDEFIILLEDLSDEEEVKIVAGRILEMIKKPLTIASERGALSITASIGIALSSLPYERPGDLLHFADSAMYQSKREGKGRFTFYE